MPAGEEVLVNTEHPRASRRTTLGGAQSQEILEPALHRGAADPLPLSQTAPADPVPVALEHTAAERFGGPLAR